MNARQLASETRNKHFFSYMPQKGQTHYPHIKPGLYIFIQDKTTKEVFLFPSIFGHGHAFPLLHLVNKSLQIKSDDESWLGSAGEQIIGYGGEILGVSVLTGKFHDKLNLTEPSSSDNNYEELIRAYTTRMTEKIEADRLPVDRFFFKNEWLKVVFTHETRIRLFTGPGSFRSTPTETQAKELQQYLKLEDSTVAYSAKVRCLLEKLFLTIQKISLEEGTKPKHSKTLTSCRSAIFYQPPANTNLSVDFSTPPGLARLISPSPATDKPVTNPDPVELVIPLENLLLEKAKNSQAANGDLAISSTHPVPAQSPSPSALAHQTLKDAKDSMKPLQNPWLETDSHAQAITTNEDEDKDSSASNQNGDSGCAKNEDALLKAHFEENKKNLSLRLFTIAQTTTAAPITPDQTMQQQLSR